MADINAYGDVITAACCHKDAIIKSPYSMSAIGMGKVTVIANAIPNRILCHA